MTAPAGAQYVIGYGGELRIPTLDLVAGGKQVIGNIVGTYNDLVELTALVESGRVTLHTKKVPAGRGGGSAGRPRPRPGPRPRDPGPLNPPHHTPERDGPPQGATT